MPPPISGTVVHGFSGTVVHGIFGHRGPRDFRAPWSTGHEPIARMNSRISKLTEGVGVMPSL